MEIDWLWVAIGVLIIFLIRESLAFIFPSRFHTLSRSIWNLGIKYPITFFLEGVFVGALSIHLYMVYSCH